MFPTNICPQRGKPQEVSSEVRVQHREPGTIHTLSFSDCLANVKLRNTFNTCGIQAGHLSGQTSTTSESGDIAAYMRDGLCVSIWKRTPLPATTPTLKPRAKYYINVSPPSTIKRIDSPRDHTLHIGSPRALEA